MPNPITQIQNILNTQNLTQISRNYLCKSLVFLYLPNCINSLCDKFIQYYAINVGFQFFFHWWHNGHCHWFDEYSQVLDSCALESLNRHLFLVEKEWYVHTKYTCVHTYRFPPDINNFFHCVVGGLRLWRADHQFLDLSTFSQCAHNSWS